MMRRICLNPMKFVSSVQSFSHAFDIFWIFDIPFFFETFQGYLCLGYVGSLVYFFSYLYIPFLISLSDTNLVQFLIICTMHLWTKLIGNICSMASLNPASPSTHTNSTSSTPRRLISLRMFVHHWLPLHCVCKCPVHLFDPRN